MVKVTVKDDVDLKVLIAEQGESLRSFANTIGISPSFLSQVINGFRCPSAVTANKIAEGLDLKIGDIFFINNVANDNPLKLTK